MKYYLLVLVLVTSMANAAEVSLKGEQTTSGYKIYFAEDKSSFLNFFGFTRLYFTENNAQKMIMPYFRFYISGQSDKKWSFNTRLDYSNAYFESKRAAGKGAPGVYWARAYVTYKENDNFSIDAGKIDTFMHEHDIFEDTRLWRFEANLGFRPKYQYDSFSTAMSVVYVDQTTQFMGEADPEILDFYLISGKVRNEFKLSGDKKLIVNIAALGDFFHQKDKFYQILPSLSFLHKGLYAYNQGLWDTGRCGKKVKCWENHFEIGKDIMPKVTSDLYFHSYHKPYTLRGMTTTHDIGLETLYQSTPRFFVQLALVYTDINDKTYVKGLKKLRPELRTEYVF